MTVAISIADARGRSEVEAFYRDQLGRDVPLEVDHQVILARDGDAVVGALRLCPEAGTLLLRTVEALSDGDRLHPLQRAFVDAGAVQCGFCTPGFVISTVALLRSNPEPSDAEIKEALAGNICRCTGYGKILGAVHRAAGQRV